jgi:hypothetical protein
LSGDQTAAYNDLHKLQRLIRDTERRVLSAPTHVEGATGFLASLTAQSHHQIGELYRSEHAYKPALKHFDAAVHQVNLLEEGKHLQSVLTDSRWHVELHVSRGKAAYEMGHHKEALAWHLHGWRRFLKLLAADTGMEANTEKIEKAIEWLERVRFEPELRKVDVSENLGPVVAQLDRITVSRRFGALAAEVLLRLGHLLFVLNIGLDERSRGGFDFDVVGNETDPQFADEVVNSTLAFDCLCKAAQCDPHSTLAGADLLKAQFRFNYAARGPLPPAYAERFEKAPAVKEVREHWPHGRDDYERLTRVAEYLTLRSRKRLFTGERLFSDVDDDASVDRLVARHLLLDFFMSTDSTNIRKSQAHRFLMRERTASQAPDAGDGPQLEFVCMRRYSSASPMLPRPSAFRALGGGYFVRLHGGAASSQVENAVDSPSGDGPGTTGYGIVIDPGTDFVETLYRSGYSVADIDMIIVTHDHVDHLGSLDPLLSLLHERDQLLATESGHGDNSRLAKQKVEVVVSRSVKRRYKFVKTLSRQGVEDERERLFKLKCFEAKRYRDGADIASDVTNGFPEGFEILFLPSAAGDERDADRRGHRDLSEEASHGVCIRSTGDGPSIAITSDTPTPPETGAPGFREWQEAWLPALQADVLLVHVSSVPLTELRQMDSPMSAPERTDDECGIGREESALLRIRQRLEAADPTLEGRIRYAQWLGSGGGGPTAEMVGEVPDGWQPPRSHPYMRGTLRWAREYMRTSSRNGGNGGNGVGLYVVGELSEELGTMRSKIAGRLNDHLFRKPARASDGDKEVCRRTVRALTADIGLHVCVNGPIAARLKVEDPSEENSSPRIRVLCAACNLDTDRVPDESYHTTRNISEVCVKGENEGIFYNCNEHNPLLQEHPVFLEQLERFDIFGR